MNNDKPIGVLITNLGTPDAPTAGALRGYLGEFLSDPRVVDLPRALWLPILHGVILRIRPARSAALYRKIWMEEGAPLRVISERQVTGLQETLNARFPGQVRVTLGMRYGNPSLGAGLRELREAGAKRIVVLPLYPQNSCSTTASTFDGVAAELKRNRDLPAIRFVSDYHDDPGYVDALAASIRDAWDASGPAERLLFSFHGMPLRYHEEGDPYFAQCRRTAEQVAARLSLPAERWQVVFQSRFGREPWLQPYTDETLKKLAGEGVRSVDVICPGFAADCLETLEEIAIANRELFLEAGGESYRYIPALNDRAEHIQALADIIGRELCGWV